VNVLVDTPIWSLALRRDPHQLDRTQRQLVHALDVLLTHDAALLIGPVRQELLSGVRERKEFAILAEHLAAFRDLSLDTEDYVHAAEFFNLCRSAGIAAGAVDLLICAAAHRHAVPIFTTDADFTRYARILPIRLFRV
jgi:predicted nucleic acid-binding protein